MARGSKTTESQPKKKSDAAREGRVALKDAPAKGRARRKEEERKTPPAAPQPRIFDERTKRDIAGVAIGVLAVVLFVTTVLPPSGFITSALAGALHAALGVGSYVLPLALVAVGACFIVRGENDMFAFRMAIGLAMLFVAFESMLSLFVPGADADTSLLFGHEALVERGGYLGAASAWVLIELLGRVVGAVVMIGVALGGAVIIGFSVSGMLKSARDAVVSAKEHIDRRREQRAAREEEESVREAPAYPQASRSSALPRVVRRPDPVPHVPRDLSRPRRASQSLSTQILAGSRIAQGGPAASSVDMYWPSDYAYDEARAALDETRAFEAKKTRVVGVEDPAEDRGPLPAEIRDHARFDAGAAPAARIDDVSAAAPARACEPGHTVALAGDAADEAPARAVLPWEDEERMEAVRAKVRENAGATRRLERPHACEAASPAEGSLSHDEGRLDGLGVGVDAQAAPVRPSTVDAVPAAAAVSRFVLDAQNDRGACVSETQALSPASSASHEEGSARPPAFASPVETPASAHVASPMRVDAAPAPHIDAPENPGERFVLPSLALLKHSEHAAEADERELAATASSLQRTLEDFNIMASVVGWVAGPTVTLFKVDLPSGVRVSRIMALQDDIALALAAPGVRIFAPIPGTNHVGIEVPNRKRQNVLLGDVIEDAAGAPLEMAIGKDVEGRSIVTDLAKMPHLLIGGTTGSGKSVAINAMIMSILMRATPDEVRFIMIDPKRVEFTPYNGIPHLYVPVVTENKEAASALAWGVAEMERRLKVMSKAGVRNIGQYNKKVEQGVFDDEADEEGSVKKMPYIVIIIDELADLMMNVGKEVELSISRIAQLARAAGIHMIVATQRPSTNVVTGLIKANITNRIAFNVASGIDSRVILDTPGAENLIGLGDMLFSKPEWPKPQRLQGCYVSEEEIEAVVAHLKAQGEPEYHQEILQTNVIGIGSSMPDGSGGSSSSDDPLLWEAADIVVASGLGSTSNIQRRLSVGYSRAGRIMDMLEEKGVVGPPNGSRPRDVLVDAMELETIKAFETNDALQDA